MTDFHLIDLVSQREAVRRHVRDHSVDDIVAWIAARGQLSRHVFSGHESYFFESTIGRQAWFFFNGDQMVFIADHTTFI